MGETEANGPVFVAEVPVPEFSGIEFKIFCDRNWNLSLFPADDGVNIWGPSSDDYDMIWQHSAPPGGALNGYWIHIAVTHDKILKILKFKS